MRGATVSPTTGKTAIDFVNAAVIACGSQTALANEAGLSTPSLVWAWLRGVCEPTYGALIAMERASGVSLDEYVPEVKRGAELFRKAGEWKEGLSDSVINYAPSFISERKRVQILRGNCREDTLTMCNLVGVCEHKKWWDEEGSKVERVYAKKTAMNASPTTGKAFVDYLRDRMQERGMGCEAFGRFTKVSSGNISKYERGLGEPSISTVRKIEEACGVSIDRYIPEINRGMAIFKNWESWKNGITLAKLRGHGVAIGIDRYESIRAGIVSEEMMTIHNAIAVCEYYDQWAEAHEGETIAPEKLAFSEEDYAREASIGLEDGEKGYQAALKIARKIIQQCRGSEVKLRRIRRNVWQFETLTVYRCEIDFESGEFRAYYRKRDGELSVRRKLREFA